MSRGESAGGRRTSGRVAINLRESRPIWSAPDDILERIAAAFPPGWAVEIVGAPGDSRGDGGDVPEEALLAARDAEIYIGYGVPPEILRSAGDALRWAHTGTAGVGGLLSAEMLAADQVVLTNSAAVHAPPIADSVIGMMLHFARGFDFAVRAQAARRWDTAPFEAATDGSVFELEGRVLGILGLGGIGREVARRGLALGMRVLATRRSPTAGPEGVTVLRGEHAVADLLRAADVLVVTLPSTRQTRGMLDAQALALLRPNAVLINVSRGDVLDETALADALRQRRLRGAALDVFSTEPLPPDSPLWSLPNVLITPHVSGTTTRFWERECALILDNVERYRTGRPLRNVVDKAEGY